MSEKTWGVAVTLSTGKTHTLVESAGTKEHAQNALDAFLQRVGLPYSGDWVEADHCWVARAQIVEARVQAL
jgi:hypothetical protein